MLEGIVASLLLLTSVIFALQMTAVTPLSASTSNQHIENQQQATAEGILSTAHETGALERAVLFWNETDSSFHNASDQGYYTSKEPPNEFGRMLEDEFGQRGIAYNVYLIYQNDAGESVRERMVYRGVPSDNAVSAGRAVTLVDDDRLYFMNGTRSPTTVENATSYGPNDVSAGPETGFYNLVRVEVVVWRV